jgi:hypothetical protein
VQHGRPAVHANVGNTPARLHELHGKLEGFRHPDRLDRDVRAQPVREFRDDPRRVFA